MSATASGIAAATAAAPRKNRCVRFVARPTGRPTPEVFRLDEAEVPELGEGEFLVRNALVSIDPALVSRMRDEKNYAETVEVGEVMHAYGIGQVVESRHAAVRPGEVRLGRFDMQELSVQSDPAASTAINLGLAAPADYLSSVGITGATAYFALSEIGRPKAGETVVVSSGGSSVGSLAAQMARRRGCRTVAIVSTPEKAERVRRDFGYDAAVSYRGRSVAELAEELRRACPQGVDVYFDNTSGDISEALLDLYNDHARIIVIGRVAISHLPDTSLDTGRRDNNAVLSRRLRKQGMVLLDYQPRMKEAVLQLARWVHAGVLRSKVDVSRGIDDLPAAFFRMLDGAGEGKQLVELSAIDDGLDPAPRWLGRLLRSPRFPGDALLSLLRRRAAPVGG